MPRNTGYCLGNLFLQTRLPVPVKSFGVDRRPDKSSDRCCTLDFFNAD
jgi:hypothetical protein